MLNLDVIVSEYEKNEMIIKSIEKYREEFEKEEIIIALRPGDDIRLMSGGGNLGIIPYEYENIEGDRVEWDIVITLEPAQRDPFIVVDDWYEKVMRESIVMEPNGYLESYIFGKRYRIPIIIKNEQLEENNREGVIIRKIE